MLGENFKYCKLVRMLIFIFSGVKFIPKSGTVYQFKRINIFLY
jgi:hypothetical protein